MSDKICTVEGCTNKVLAKGLCNKHRHQMLRGGILKRTKFHPNEIIIYEDYAEIVLYNKNNEEIARTLINLEDVEVCKQYKWYLKDTGYAVTGINDNGKRIIKKLHQIIIGDYLDHANQNKLDNRRNNLRPSTHCQNRSNSIRKTNANSDVMGVRWYKRDSKWIAGIRVNKQYHHLGYYEDFDQAVIARLKAEKEICGEFAPQKHLFEKYNINDN